MSEISLKQAERIIDAILARGRRLKCRPLAVVVTDLRMPGTTGLDLQDALRRSGRELPVIVSSGQADAATAARVRAAGAVRFLVKPFDVLDLFTAVDEALRRDQATMAES